MGRFHHHLAVTGVAFLLLAPFDGTRAQTPLADSPPGESAREAVDLFAALDPADRPIAEKMRDRLAAKADKIFTDQKQQKAVETFYQNRSFAPLWLEKGSESKRVKPVVARLRSADTDGLDPAEYGIPNFTGDRPDALAEAELKLTAAVVAYARHLQAGRVSYQRVSRKNIELPQVAPEPAEVLGKLAEAKDGDQALDTFRPPQPQYAALRAVLAKLRAERGTASDLVAEAPPGKSQKIARNDPRAARPDAPGRDKQIDIVIANMERWRWMPRDLGQTHVIVNLPDYSLKLVKDGAAIWTTKIVIGKPAMQTPLTSATMKSITVNPTWNVPPSIVQNEYLPALRNDPYALARIGLRMSRNRDGSIHIYQPPGERNALGRLRFNFPNRFLVYQHDTPQKNLFALDARAYSHGCMRVLEPARYAELLLSIARPNDGYTAERIARLYGKGESDIPLSTTIPVHLTYQTASVENGKLVLRKDVYDYDGKVLAAIGGKTVQEAGEKTQGSFRRAAMRFPQRFRYYDRPSYYRPRFESSSRWWW